LKIKLDQIENDTTNINTI